MTMYRLLCEGSMSDFRFSEIVFGRTFVLYAMAFRYYSSRQNNLTEVKTNDEFPF